MKRRSADRYVLVARPAIKPGAHLRTALFGVVVLGAFVAWVWAVASW